MVYIKMLPLHNIVTSVGFWRFGIFLLRIGKRIIQGILVLTGREADLAKGGKGASSNIKGVHGGVTTSGTCIRFLKKQSQLYST